MKRERARSTELLARMAHIVPGSASSNVRTRNTIAVSRGIGGELIDLDGNRYIDYVLGFGPILLGHGHPAVTEAVARAISHGTTFAFTTESEYRVCEQIVALSPSVEMVRLCNSGTDAAAAEVVLSILATADYVALMRRGERLAHSICDCLAVEGIPARWNGTGAMFGITIGPDRPTNYKTWWLQTDRKLWMDVSAIMRDLGVLSDDFIGLFFLSFAHTDEQIDRTLTAYEEAIHLYKRGKGTYAHRSAGHF